MEMSSSGATEDWPPLCLLLKIDVIGCLTAGPSSSSPNIDARLEVSTFPHLLQLSAPYRSSTYALQFRSKFENWQFSCFKDKNLDYDGILETAGDTMEQQPNKLDMKHYWPFKLKKVSIEVVGAYCCDAYELS
ncbi:hypothetical protein R6Q59_016032 [Mikania micrantha]|uniref:Uncharacterized protein n=1 Tax=Mikania micrantha TaxID=192012 RepID=A0A5N6P0Z6_9ASTR|nr:hypothetical protein E3N88_16613 [Mikania micrantha]